jgi:2-dehydro-3-deoxyphosphogluconate aldolase/(4S)-4-hydroxy-2-oxoglutarate aldolase
MRTVTDIMKVSQVIPVLVIDRLEDAGPLARALYSGGLKVLEVTLRTPAGLPAIAAMKAAAPDAIVGAGTVNSAAQLALAAEAGAEFIVSPGLTPAIVSAAQARNLPILPGVASAGDILRGLELGLTAFKFFPAETSGGAAALKALEGPFGNVQFCPTGGVTLTNAPTYFALKSVLCVGGSWVTPKSAVEAKNWETVERLAYEAAQLST